MVGGSAPAGGDIRFRVELAQVRAHVPHDLLHAFRVGRGDGLVPILGHENQVGTQDEDTMPVRADVRGLAHEFEYAFNMQLRYSYRIDPWPRHRIAFGKGFGCARFVVNDALALREAAYEAGLPYVTDAQLSARLTAAKRDPARVWLTEVSAVVLQQALADLNTAYRNFFASRHGDRAGPKIAKPRFRSRKDHRRAIRFTANARFKVLGNGKLRLPKIGDVPVRWSRPLPSAPSSATVIKDAAGRYFASFVIETEPGALHDAETAVGHRSGAQPLRRVVGRTEDHRPAVSAPGRAEPQAPAARPAPLFADRNPPEVTPGNGVTDGNLRPSERSGSQRGTLLTTCGTGK